MKILSVKGKNLLSLGEFELQFSDSGLVLVEGWNYDDNRANGAGKTAIFNLLSLAIFQKIPRKVTMAEIIKRGEKRGEVTATVRVADDTYTMLYGRPKKRVVTRNGIELDITQEELEETLGLTYENFLISMYAVQGGGNKFLNLNDTDKKQFLLQLMNLKSFQECRKEAISRAADLDKELLAINMKVSKAESKLEVYRESLSNVNEIRKALDLVQNDRISFDSKIIEQQKVKKPDLNKFLQLEEKIIHKLDEFCKLSYDRCRIFSEYQNLIPEIDVFKPKNPDAHCPACSIPLSITSGSVVPMEDQGALKKQHDEYVTETRLRMAKMKQEIDEIDERLYEEKSVKNLEVKLKEKKDNESRAYNSAQAEIQNLQFSISSKQSEINHLEKELQQAKGVEEKTRTLETFIERSEPLRVAKQKEVEAYMAVANMYSPTGAPAYVMDSIVESFNDAVNDHIGLVWPNATYQLRSHKEKKTGDIVAKFSEDLVINGQPTSIGALSGGEQRAFSLSIDFAIADILSRQFGIPLNPIIMDEPFEGLDATGREVVIELLEKLSVDRQIWVIDHMSESKSMFSHILRVEKRNGTSAIDTVDMV